VSAGRSHWHNKGGDIGTVVIDMSMSVDGYIAAPDDNPEQGLGVRLGQTDGVTHLEYRLIR
jgi:hypothetical protein